MKQSWLSTTTALPWMRFPASSDSYNSARALQVPMSLQPMSASTVVTLSARSITAWSTEMADIFVYSAAIAVDSSAVPTEDWISMSEA